jgi:bifunctional UDP-N-acetylglucosamine pyrophosphorylase / glucosamine-1-phosphate N-acetyltransferase
MEINEHNEISELLKNLSSPLNYNSHEIAIILAAGHGKRIKSQKSKMLHKIWGIPTVERVFNACRHGIKDINIILVVGIKAKDVMGVLGKREAASFAYQATQNGTGHAVQVALKNINHSNFEGIVYVLPGDMGLIDYITMQNFREEFVRTKSDMMVLTGIFEGKPSENAYGRIIRVKQEDAEGNPSGKDYGRVIEIMEHKDILSLPENEPYKVTYNNRVYSFSKKELIENNEFNSGVYAFDYKKLIELIHSIESNNVQNEIYITDLISLFNKKQYTISAVSPHEPYVVMGFNNKSVLKEMEAVARKIVYEKVKDIIEIDDPDDFFIDESVVENIIEMDKRNIPLDIYIGKGVHIGKGVKLNYGAFFSKNVYINGNVNFGTNVTIRSNVHLSCFPEQSIVLGDGVKILSGNFVRGNVKIGSNTIIESSVTMTGNNEFPVIIGNNVIIRGTSYLFGSIVEDDVRIEHSIIIKKRVEKLVKRDGSIQPIRFYLPLPEGIDAIEDL